MAVGGRCPRPPRRRFVILYRIAQESGEKGTPLLRIKWW